VFKALPKVMIKKSIQWIIASVAISSLLTGCAISPPHAWEKEVLSLPEMSLSGAEGRAETHIYTSKENSRGNGIMGLGGCGCN
jgi:hypothetical protein